MSAKASRQRGVSKETKQVQQVTKRTLTAAELQEIRAEVARLQGTLQQLVSAQQQAQQQSVQFVSAHQSPVAQSPEPGTEINLNSTTETSVETTINTVTNKTIETTRNLTTNVAADFGLRDDPDAATLDAAGKRQRVLSRVPALLAAIKELQEDLQLIEYPVEPGTTTFRELNLAACFVDGEWELYGPLPRPYVPRGRGT